MTPTPYKTVFNLTPTSFAGGPVMRMLGSVPVYSNNLPIISSQREGEGEE